MNKRLTLPISLLLVAMLISGCGFQIVTGSDKVSSENRTVADFSSITLASIGDVIITQADTTSVKIEAEDNLIQYFDTSVSGSTLTIGIKPQFIGVNLHPTKPVKFYVSTPTLNGVTLAGSGNMLAGDVNTQAFKAALLGSGNITTDSLTATSVEINLAGSGDVSFGKLTADTLSSTIAGSGNVTVAGSVTGQTAKIVGSGDYRSSNLQSKTAQINVTGSGNSQISVSDTLNVTILGSGDVVYTGKPSISSSIAGSGRIKSAE